ncbi:hypothetical protein Cgig2_017881 [Carnegiea gigantea]|uniref:Uncharacterized protein n=1 Tax=Carnegiea gigantea TaxID=171969 RepID=A0A9Q1JYK7_9CARY|nr:hypothetical protein Cgig2_017881 [Carnegiea gigantea]
MHNLEARLRECNAGSIYAHHDKSAIYPAEHRKAAGANVLEKIGACGEPIQHELEGDMGSEGREAHDDPSKVIPMDELYMSNHESVNEVVRDWTNLILNESPFGDDDVASRTIRCTWECIVVGEGKQTSAATPIGVYKLQSDMMDLLIPSPVTGDTHSHHQPPLSPRTHPPQPTTRTPFTTDLPNAAPVFSASWSPAVIARLKPPSPCIPPDHHRQRLPSQPPGSPQCSTWVLYRSNLGAVDLDEMI